MAELINIDMRIIKNRCPVWNNITRQIEYKELEFVVEDNNIYYAGECDSTGIESREYDDSLRIM
jgi:hypothetical protein